MRGREGGLATLTVYVSGAPRPDVYWRKDRRDVDTLQGRFRVIDGGTLQVGRKEGRKESDSQLHYITGIFFAAEVDVL